ncbi:hypothetical protein [Bacillus thuringiensis]
MLNTTQNRFTEKNAIEKAGLPRCLFRSVFKELLGRSFATSLC